MSPDVTFFSGLQMRRARTILGGAASSRNARCLLAWRTEAHAAKTRRVLARHTPEQPCIKRPTTSKFLKDQSLKFPNLEPWTLNPKPRTLNPKPYTRNSKSQFLTPHPKPSTQPPQLQTLNPRPQTLNPKSQPHILHPQHQTLHPKT